MQVGPSLTINPVDKLKTNIYFRYAPSYSLTMYNPKLFSNYASCFVTGASVSYGVIGLGAEYRFGSSSYKGAYDNDGYQKDGARSKWSTSGVRTYITFRF